MLIATKKEIKTCVIGKTGKRIHLKSGNRWLGHLAKGVMPRLCKPKWHPAEDVLNGEQSKTSRRDHLNSPIEVY